MHITTLGEDKQPPLQVLDKSQRILRDGIGRTLTLSRDLAATWSGPLPVHSFQMSTPTGPTPTASPVRG